MWAVPAGYSGFSGSPVPVEPENRVSIPACGLLIKIRMKDGQDYSKINKRLGIRQICIYGNYLDDGDTKRMKLINNTIKLIKY